MGLEKVGLKFIFKLTFTLGFNGWLCLLTIAILFFGQVISCSVILLWLKIIKICLLDLNQVFVYTCFVLLAWIICLGSAKQSPGQTPRLDDGLFFQSLCIFHTHFGVLHEVFLFEEKIQHGVAPNSTFIPGPVVEIFFCILSLITGAFCKKNPQFDMHTFILKSCEKWGKWRKKILRRSRPSLIDPWVNDFNGNIKCALFISEGVYRQCMSCNCRVLSEFVKKVIKL